MRKKLLIILFFVLSFNLLKINVFGVQNNIKTELDIKKIIVQKIIAQYPYLTSSDIKIEVKEEGNTKLRPDLVYKLDLDKINDFLGTLIINLKIYDGRDKFLETKSLMIQSKAYTNFFITAKKIKRGDIIKEEDLKKVYNEIYRKPKNFLREKEMILGKEAVITIPENTLIVKSMLKSVPVVKKGDVILITYKENNFQIKLSGTAYEEGETGDFIYVRGENLPKKIKGEIIDSKNIIIRPVSN